MLGATYAYLVALFCSNRRKFNYMILAFHEDTFCDNVQSVEKRGMKFHRPWSDRNLCCRGNNRNRSFQKVGNIEDIFLIFFFFFWSFISLVSTRETRAYGERSGMDMGWVLGFLETSYRSGNYYYSLYFFFIVLLHLLIRKYFACFTTLFASFWPIIYIYIIIALWFETFLWLIVLKFFGRNSSINRNLQEILFHLIIIKFETWRRRDARNTIKFHLARSWSSFESFNFQNSTAYPQE